MFLSQFDGITIDVTIALVGPSIIQIGNFAIGFYGIIIAFSTLLAWLFSRVRAKKFGLDPSHIDNLVLLLIPVCLVGARLYHVFDHWDFYKINPLQILAIWQGGLGIFGALFFGLIVFFLYTFLTKTSLLKLFDVVSIPILFAQGLGRFGNFFNKEVLGTPTDLPWKIFIEPERRIIPFENERFFHPTFFYEAIWDLTAVFIILGLERKMKFKKGTTFSLYLLFFSLGRFWTEFLRIDTWQIGGIKIALVFSVLGMLAGIFLLLFIYGKIRILQKI